jgi:hypothetical protein
VHILDGNAFDWYHFWENFLSGFSIFAMVMLAFYKYHREDKKERLKRNEEIMSAARQLETKNEERHAENIIRLVKIETMLGPIWDWWRKEGQR